jgi:hypothetical protein
MTEIYITSSRSAFKMQLIFYNHNIPSGFLKGFEYLWFGNSAEHGKSGK